MTVLRVLLMSLCLAGSGCSGDPNTPGTQEKAKNTDTLRAIDSNFFATVYCVKGYVFFATGHGVTPHWSVGPDGAPRPTPCEPVEAGR